MRWVVEPGKLLADQGGEEGLHSAGSQRLLSEREICPGSLTWPSALRG